MSAASPKIKGLTTIVWGTNNSLGAPAGAIVESISLTPKNGEPIADIENNDGASATLVLLKDGFTAKVGVVFDSAKAWPDWGDNVGLTLPTVGGNANAAPTTFCCICVDDVPALARKKEASLEISLVYRPGVAP